MPNKPRTHNPRRQYKQPERRPTSDQRGYDRRWRKARAAWLAEHPLCAECERRDLVAAATVVDHVVPHKGNIVLFWDASNWQSLCTRCHNEKTAREGAFGRPMQPDNRAGNSQRQG